MGLFEPGSRSGRVHGFSGPVSHRKDNDDVPVSGKDPGPGSRHQEDRMNKVTVKDLDLKGKKVLVRVDYNVPLGEDGRITDDNRIRASLETLRYILDAGARKVILVSHLGRPKGQVVDSLRLDPVARKLQELIGQPVLKLDKCVGEEVNKAIESPQTKIVLLENVRFYSQETKGDEEFSRQLASLADVYVNDAFGTAHRAHASTTIVAGYLPSAIGFLIEKEITYLSKALSPEKPYVIILGGAKVSDKIGVVDNLMEKADVFLIGGAMAYTFLKAQDIPVGNSRVEEDKVELAREILTKAEEKNVQIVLPVDHVAVESIDKPETKTIAEEIPDGFMGVDIGPITINTFADILKKAKTVLWNGPVGIFENPRYAEGTKEIAMTLGDLVGVTVIVGGGDSAAAASEFSVKDKLSHVSTGGGASLEFLEGKELPGIAAISDK